jgi:hypothetical protein
VPEISAVGDELDRKVATPLAAIGVDAWPAFGIEHYCNITVESASTPLCHYLI